MFFFFFFFSGFPLGYGIVGVWGNCGVSRPTSKKNFKGHLFKRGQVEHVLTMVNLKLKPSLFPPRPGINIDHIDPSFVDKFHGGYCIKGATQWPWRIAQIVKRFMIGWIQQRNFDAYRPIILSSTCKPNEHHMLLKVSHSQKLFHFDPSFL